jgi:hypothetical protein
MGKLNSLKSDLQRTKILGFRLAKIWKSKANLNPVWIIVRFSPIRNHLIGKHSSGRKSCDTVPFSFNTTAAQILINHEEHIY